MITVAQRHDNVVGAGPYWLVNFDTDDEADQLAVMLEAARIYADRSEKYGQNWKRQGWRGSLFKLRLGVERAWDSLWNAEPTGPEIIGRTLHDGQQPHDVDDLLDAINHAVWVVRQVRVGDRDGNWIY